MCVINVLLEHWGFYKMNQKLQKILLVLILGLIQTVTTSFADTNSGLEIKLSMPQEGYFSADQLKLDVILTNTSSDAITFLKWGTPFENDFTDNILTIQYEGQIVRYIGKIVKRAPPEENDFITIAVGETISTSLDISEGYAIENRGDYTVAFNKHLQIANNFAAKRLSDVTFKEIEAQSPVVGFKLNEERNVIQRAKQANFSSCSASQQSVLNDAHAASIAIAKESRDILMNTAVSEQATAERYTTWFGSHTSARYSTATNHFTNIHDGLANQQVTFLCDCNENFFAYVFVGDAYNIHLCNAFWRANLIGTDSQAGTLVHEMSHFRVVASTDDHAYGTNAAKNLANNNPTDAVDNADNHEYFAENTPSLSMGSNTGTVTKDIYEDNNSSADAKTITSGNDQAHRIVPSADQDWTKFVLTEESNVTITTSGVEGDTLLSLFDSSGANLLGQNDNNAPSSFSKITQTALAAGTYFIKVEEKGNDAEIAAYTLSFSSNRTYEPNNSQDAAETIPTGSTQLLSISPSTDQDWLKFTLDTESELILQVTADADEDIVFSLLDDKSTVLASAKQATVDKTASGLLLKETQSTLAAGTYFIKVEENGNDATIDSYSLSISSKPTNTGSASGGGGYLSIELLSLLVLLGLFKVRRRYLSNKMN